MADPPRKAGEPLERHVERIIREAQEQGELDRLSGQGKPLRSPSGTRRRRCSWGSSGRATSAPSARWRARRGR